MANEPQTHAAPPPTPTPKPKPVTAESILALRQIGPPTEPYEVPGVGTVVLHGLTNLQAKQWRAGCSTDEQGRIADPYADAHLIVASCRTPEGKPIFTDKHLTQIVDLGEFIVGRMVRRILRLSGMGEEADEQIVKNYAATVARGS